MEKAVLSTALLLSGMLILPLAIEWLRKFQITAVCLVMGLAGLWCLAPVSPPARAVLTDLQAIPGLFAQAAQDTEDGLAKLSSEYYNAFH